MRMKYSDYKKLGYSVIPKKEFTRYSGMAEKTAMRFINTLRTRDVYDIPDMTEENKRGICEIANILYTEENQLNRPIAGFTNEKYREQYFKGADLSKNEKIWEIMCAYFTHEQLYRGV